MVLIMTVNSGCQNDDDRQPNSNAQSGRSKNDLQAICGEFDDQRVIEVCNAIQSGEKLSPDEVAIGVSAATESGLTPLLWSVVVGNVEAVEMLMACGADCTVPCNKEISSDLCVVEKGMTPVHVAATSDSIQCLNALLESGANANIKADTLMEETPVFSAIRHSRHPYGAIEALKEHGADLNYVSGHGTPAIYAAVWLSKYKVALEVLLLGGDPRAPTINGRTRLAHLLLREPVVSRVQSSDEQRDYHKLIEWLGEHGEDMKSVQRDVDSGDF